MPFPPAPAHIQGLIRFTAATLAEAREAKPVQDSGGAIELRDPPNG